MTNELIEGLEWRAKWLRDKVKGEIRYPNGEFVFQEIESASLEIMAVQFEVAISALREREWVKIEDRVQKWCVECFGETTAADVVERNWRFLEEALELVQSLGGSKDDVIKMVDYTYNRERGEPHQEMGGTMVTLAALSAANGMDMMQAFEDEFARINRPEMIEKIRGKHATKPHKSPLPGDYKHAKPPTEQTP